MKTKNLITATLITASIATQTFASEIISENRTAKNFYGIVLNTNANIVLTQGDEQSVKVVGGENEISNLKTEVNNGKLIISDLKTEGDPVKIYVTVTDLNLLEVNGGGNITGNGMINADNLTLKVKGSGKIKIDVRTLIVVMNAESCGTIDVSGNAGTSSATVTENGKVFSENFTSFCSKVDKSAISNPGYSCKGQNTKTVSEGDSVGTENKKSLLQ